MMRRAAPILAVVLALPLSAAAEERAVLLFQPNANRLAPGFEGQLAQLKTWRGAAPNTSLVMVAPKPADPARRRLVQARQAELDRQLAKLGLGAEHESDSHMEGGGNELVLLLRYPAAPPETATADTPAEPAPPWIAESGGSLRQTLQAWADKAGWTLVWQSSFDYPLMASARLGGEFPQAVTALLQGFSEAVPPPAARLFNANQVVIIH